MNSLKMYANLLFRISLISFFLFLNSCSPYETRIHSTDFSDDFLIEVVENIEKNQTESSKFAQLGHNRYSSYLNIMILLSAILAGIISAIEGSKLWSKTSKGRLKTLFLLSIIATIASSTGFYFKSESERFFQEEKDKYAILSIEMDEVIREFYFSFRRENFTDETIKIDSIRKEFINVSNETFKKLGNLRKTYAKNYRIDTN